MSPLWAVSDLHGHLDTFLAALRREGLVDAAGHWTGGPGGDARLWVLGDYFDRGPDGIGVLRLVRRLVEESAGAVTALLGNHEVLAVGTRLFGATPVPGGGEVERSFARSWLRNGGRLEDQEALTDDDVAWLRTRPVVGLDGDFLLLHSDTLRYLDWGDSVASVNEGAAADLASHDLGTWWRTWIRTTERYAYRGEHGAAVAGAVLATLGGRVLVHGHSIAAELRGVPYDAVTEAWSYAGGRVLAIDGGIYEGGPCLLTRLA